MQRNLTKTQNKSLGPVNNYEDKRNLVPENFGPDSNTSSKIVVCIYNK